MLVAIWYERLRERDKDEKAGMACSCRFGFRGPRSARTEAAAGIGAILDLSPLP